MGEETLLARLPEWEEELGKITRETITVEQAKWLRTTIGVSDYYARWPVDSLSPEAWDGLMRVHGMLKEFARAVGRDFGIRGGDLFSPYGEIKDEAWQDLRGAVAEKQPYPEPVGRKEVLTKDHPNAHLYQQNGKWCDSAFAREEYNIGSSALQRVATEKGWRGVKAKPRLAATGQGKKPMRNVYLASDLHRMANAFPDPNEPETEGHNAGSTPRHKKKK